MNNEQNPKIKGEQLLHTVISLNSRVIGLAVGVICGLTVFVATNWLVIKGGETVGPHLSLLGQYFFGYRVTFSGSLIGAVYGFILGMAGGSMLGWIYNTIALMRKGE